MIGRLPGLPAAIMDLAYAPNGSAFVVGFAKTAGIRLYNAGGTMIADDANYGDRVSAIAFDANNRFAVSSYDGQIRLYGADGKRIAAVEKRRAARGLHRLASRPTANRSQSVMTMSAASIFWPAIRWRRFWRRRLAISMMAP